MPLICYLCENNVEGEYHVECNMCRSFNGDPFVYCLTCGDDRKAIIAHQANRGASHLFKRVPQRLSRWFCDVCSGTIDGTTCYTCPTCPLYGGFDMCLKCSSPGSWPKSKARHEHRMIPVRPDGTITQSHIQYLQMPDPGPSCWCDSCGKEPVTGLLLSCTKCCNAASPCQRAGYDVCAKCADEDRATYLHCRWSPRKEQHGKFSALWGRGK